MIFGEPFNDELEQLENTGRLGDNNYEIKTRPAPNMVAVKKGLRK